MRRPASSTALRERRPDLVRARLRGHLLRDAEPPGRGARDRAALRADPRRRLAELVELAAPRRGRASAPAARAAARRARRGDPARAARRRAPRRRHRRRLGARAARRSRSSARSTDSASVTRQRAHRRDRGHALQPAAAGARPRRPSHADAQRRKTEHMPVPARQSMRIGAYIMRQKLARRERFPLLVELEPLYQCNLACAGCGKIQQPDELLRRRMPVEDAIARDRGERRADGLDRRRRAADPPRHPPDRRGADQAAQVRLPVHQRAADGAQDGPLQALAVLRVGGPHRRPARAPRRVGLPRRRLRQGGRRDRRGQAPRLPRDDEHDVLHPRLAGHRARACSTSSTTSSRSTR